MASKLIFLIGFCLLQGTWSYPNPAGTSATTSSTVSTGTGTSAGTKLSADFNKNLASILSNSGSGMTSLVSPFMKMANGVPSLINSVVQTGAQKVAKLSEANKENSAKIASGVTKVVGGGMNLGTAVAGGLMTVAGGGVDAVRKVVDSGAKGALSMGSQMVDNGITRLDTLASLGEGVMEMAGDGMSAAGGSVTVLTNGLSKTIASISDRMEQSIKNAADTITKLMQQQATTTNANVADAAKTVQSNVYNMLNNYLIAMTSMQNVFETSLASMPNSSSVTTPTNGATVISGDVHL